MRFALAVIILLTGCESTMHRAAREDAEDDAYRAREALLDTRPQPKLPANRHWPRDEDAWMLQIMP